MTCCESKGLREPAKRGSTTAQCDESEDVSEGKEVSARQLRNTGGIKVAQGIVDRGEHKDSEVVSETTKEVQVII